MTDPIDTLLRDVAMHAAALGRDDLARRMDAARDRRSRPEAVIGVVGDYGQGKTTLVNTLVGDDACPVGHDRGTAVMTVVAGGEDSSAHARRRGGRRDPVDPAVIAAIVLDPGDADVEAVEVRGSFPGLPAGMAIVDTPGVGGLHAGQAAALTALLGRTDAVLVVSDASAELTEPEADLLRRAADACPMVALCLTKVDLYPEWRTIEARNRLHVDRLGLDVRIYPLAAPVRWAAAARRDPGLDRGSGYAALADALAAGVNDPARIQATRRALDECLFAVDLLLRGTAVSAASGLAHLHGAGSGWRMLVNERFSALGRRADRELQARIRQLAAETDAAIDRAASPADWDGAAVALQRDVAAAVGDVVAMVEGEAAAVTAAVVASLAHADLDLPSAWVDALADDLADVLPEAPWTERPGAADRGPGVLRHGRLMAQGASDVGDLLGLLSRLLPAGAGALLLANPIMLGAGVLVGGRAIADGRRHHLAARREVARAATRRWLDEAGFRLGGYVGELVLSVQERLRATVAARLDAVERTWAATGHHSPPDAGRVAALAELQRRAVALRGGGDG